MKTLIPSISCVVISLTVEAATFTNGSFELSAFAANGSYVFPTNTPGWRASVSPPPAIKRGMSKHSNCCDLWFAAVDGTQCTLFSSGAWIEQAFDTIPGEDYEITFNVGHDEVSLEGLSIQATARSDTGDILASLSVGSPPGFCTEWLPQSRILFRASTTNTILRFLDEASPQAHNTPCQNVTASLAVDNVALRLAPLSPTIHVSEIKLCWECLTSHVYQVQYTTNLASNVWVNFGGSLSNLSGINCIADNIEDSPKKFYRVFRPQ